MAYCVKCRTQREVLNPEATVMKNKKPAISGVCPVCGTKLFRIGDNGGGGSLSLYNGLN